MQNANAKMEISRGLPILLPINDVTIVASLKGQGVRAFETSEAYEKVGFNRQRFWTSWISAETVGRRACERQGRRVEIDVFVFFARGDIEVRFTRACGICVCNVIGICVISSSC